MNNSLMIYLNKRLHENKMYPQENREPGPVITISREVGCGGVKLAKMLAEELNHNFAICKSWRVLSKEIFQESAKELNMEMSKLNKILKESDRNTFDEILAAFGDKHYKSERIIRKTVIDVISSFGKDGCCIIVGRASHIICRDIEKSLHIRLTAPIKWRTEQIAQSHQITMKEALEFIEKTEKEREAFRKHISEQAHHDNMFDLILNIEKLAPEQVIQIILHVAKVKGLLEKRSSKIEVF